MRERERVMARRRLDTEMRVYRMAGRKRNPTNDLLRAVRKALKIRSYEIAAKIGRTSGTVFEIERKEAKGTVGLRDLARFAEAMDCHVVYGVVPKGGRTLEELYQERLWAVVLGTGIRK